MERREATQETDASLNTSKETSKRTLPENPNLKESETSSLGKVEMKPLNNRKSSNVSQETMNEKSFKTKGIQLPLDRLPTKGQFYPADTKIYIKSAKVSEIKDYSLMDETNPLDVNDRLNNVLSFCTTIECSISN